MPAVHGYYPRHQRVIMARKVRTAMGRTNTGGMQHAAESDGPSHGRARRVSRVWLNPLRRDAPRVMHRLQLEQLCRHAHLLGGGHRRQLRLRVRRRARHLQRGPPDLRGCCRALPRCALAPLPSLPSRGLTASGSGREQGCRGECAGSERVSKIDALHKHTQTARLSVFV